MMKKKLRVLFFLMIWASQISAQSTFAHLSINSITPIKAAPVFKQRLMRKHNQACKSLLDELVLVKIPYWGFDDQMHVGALIVHESLGSEVVFIFNALFEHRFPIQTMDAFECRNVTDQIGILSQHAYGRAIDINTKQNPYIKENLIIPTGSRKYILRTKPEKGKIIPNTFVTALFAHYGWDWGGDWLDLKDYQHFEKRAHGEKRDRFGYPGLRFGLLYQSHLKV